MSATDTLILKALKALPSKAATDYNKVLLKEIGLQIAEEDARFFTPDLLSQIIQNHGDLASTRDTGEPRVMVYTLPSVGHMPPKTYIDVVSDDFAFLVDSVVAEINNNNFLIDLFLHPIVHSLYNDKGQLQDIHPQKTEGYVQQSHMHIQLRGVPSKEDMKALEEGLRVVLKDVAMANRDWPQMLAHLKQAREDLANAKTRRPLKEVEQYCAFLDYLYENNYTLLGYREYEFVEKDGELKSKTIKSSGLGLLHNAVRPAYISEREEGLPRNLQEKRRNLPPLSISKTNRLSTVHRRVPMDAVAIKIYDEQGNVKGEKLFLGLFTSVTYSRSVGDVPFLREKVDEVVEMSNFVPNSHNRKALRHILEKYPRDELFQISAKDLYNITVEILRLQERQRIALFVRKDDFNRYISCLVYVPRDRFGTALREKMCEILERELDGQCYNFTTSLDDSVFARVMFIINVRQRENLKIDVEELERQLQEAGQTWPELLAMALSRSYEEDKLVSSLALKYGEAFPVGYTTRYRAAQAVFDIHKMEEMLQSGRLELDLYRPEGLDPHQLRLKVYNPGRPLNLSDVMPILANLGLRAVSELPFEVRPADHETSIWIHDFLLEVPDRKDKIDVEIVKANFEAGFSKIWAGEMENDGLNRLILLANMDWREITILRAYVRYLKQIRFPFSRPYVEKALNQHSDISGLIVDMFKASLDPHAPKGAQKEADKHKAKIEKALEKVESLDQDRILRQIAALVEATLRTNYFQKGADGQAKPYLSMKFNCSKVPNMPAPRPYREIFVYSPQVEGVHLRGDKIARGGLRWSDRHEDFRTEVLGLMKAQMVKNSVIVPMGSKGGFVVKIPTASRDEFMKAGIECYKTFIRGLLDLTDNRQGTKIVPPKDVVRRDGDDPYLVVAADKGTASFSDIANGLSEEYGFWLGDAFASGGSAGYDHKKMGITARGAWESVKHLFRQLNHNTQEAPFDVVGVGDMGGDVFGNGMLLSEHIRLIGAFNHLHIFCDPNPDSQSSYKERKRLFDAVKGWGDYDASKLSKGGRIYERSEKSLALTPEIQKRFDIDKDKVSPDELMKAILKSRADLLWFGGIGTYIKASSESNDQVGDKANDAIRLNAKDVRAKVVGEGANLGVTQLGRIEFSKAGGKINTDFVDNSGGVNSSDLEVNIKILLRDVMDNKAHKMDLKVRNKLLERMTDDVAELVLRNNYQQVQAVSLAELQAREDLQAQNNFIRDLERDKGLNRALEGLPDEEAIERRLRAGKGLTRPELCILVSYAKIGFTQDLLASDVPDSPDMQDWLYHYFPDDLREAYAPEIKRHRLAREIIATQMANSLVNRMGPTFLSEMMKKTGASPDQIAKAYLIVREIFGLRGLWDKIEGLDNKVPAQVQLKAMREIHQLSEHCVAWFLTRFGRDLEIGREIREFSPKIEALQKVLPKIVTSDVADGIEARTRSGEKDGLPKALAHDIALMHVLSSACDIIRVALDQKADLAIAAQAYFEVGQHFHMDWLRQQARFLPVENSWQSEATRGLIDQIYGCQAALTGRILRDTSGTCRKEGSKVSCSVEWLGIHETQLKKLEPLFVDLRRVGSVDLSMLVIAEQRLRNLAGA